jgi:hypothetical protein
MSRALRASQAIKREADVVANNPPAIGSPAALIMEMAGTPTPAGC